MSNKKITTKKSPANPSRDGFFKWTLEIQVHKTWVEDGFDLDDERAHEMLCHHLPYAYGHELKAKVLSAPGRKAIRKTQGYKG